MVDRIEQMRLAPSLATQTSIDARKPSSALLGALVLALAVGCLAGCGQKGPLILPKAATAASAASATGR
jgi:predicted small lipoprotein YifL